MAVAYLLLAGILTIGAISSASDERGDGRWLKQSQRDLVIGGAMLVWFALFLVSFLI